MEVLRYQIKISKVVQVDIPVKIIGDQDAHALASSVARQENGWDFYRRTKGTPPGNKATSKRGNRAKHADYTHDKDCWLYGLNNIDRKRLTQRAADVESTRR
jgi:hypothetical protein